MKGIVGRILASFATVMAFSDAAKVARDERRRQQRDQEVQTTRNVGTSSRSVRYLHPTGNVYYVTKDGTVYAYDPMSVGGADALARLAALGPVRLLPRRERRRLVGVHDWRRDLRAPGKLP